MISLRFHPLEDSHDAICAAVKKANFPYSFRSQNTHADWAVPSTNQDVSRARPTQPPNPRVSQTTVVYHVCCAVSWTLPEIPFRLFSQSHHANRLITLIRKPQQCTHTSQCRLYAHVNGKFASDFCNRTYVIYRGSSVSNS